MPSRPGLDFLFIFLNDGVLTFTGEMSNKIPEVRGQKSLLFFFNSMHNLAHRAYVLMVVCVFGSCPSYNYLHF